MGLTQLVLLRFCEVPSLLVPGVQNILGMCCWLPPAQDHRIYRGIKALGYFAGQKPLRCPKEPPGRITILNVGLPAGLRVLSESPWVSGTEEALEARLLGREVSFADPRRTAIHSSVKEELPTNLSSR